MVIAYEPVWSIGEGGIPADPDFADRQHARIKQVSLRRLRLAGRRRLWRQRQSRQLLRPRRGPNIDGLFIGRSAWE